MSKTRSVTAIAVTLALGACVAAPTAPTVLALPAPGKPYAQFQSEDYNCRATAEQATAGQAEAANNRAIGGTVLGTALGAAGGALIGSAFGNPGAGAAVGATAGLGIGGSYGGSSSATANYTLQQRFDIVYTQCMYASHNTVQAQPMGFAAYPVVVPYERVYAAPYPPAYAAPYPYPYARPYPYPYRPY